MCLHNVVEKLADFPLLPAMEQGRNPLLSRRLHPQGITGSGGEMDVNCFCIGLIGITAIMVFTSMKN